MQNKIILTGIKGGKNFYKHEHMEMECLKDEEEGTMLGRWLAQANLLLGLLALTFALLAVIVLLKRRRNRHPGFIEVG